MHDSLAPAPAARTLPTLTDLLDFARAAAADPAVTARLTLHPTERTWVSLDGPGAARRG